MHYIYHIPEIKKVGATEDLDKRVTDKQGWKKEEYDVVCQTESLAYASDIEKALQQFYGYSEDQVDYKTIKTMRKMKRSNSKMVGGVLVMTQLKDTGNVGVNLDLQNKGDLAEIMMNGAKFKLFDGTEVNFASDEIEFLLKYAEKSQFPGGDFFFRVKNVTNLRYDLSDQEATAAAEIAAMEEEGEYFIDGFTSRGGVHNPNFYTEVDTKAVPPQRQQNVCSDLNVGDYTSIDFDRLMLMQKSLQQKFTETNHIGDSNVSLAQIATDAQRNWHAFGDEFMEFMDAIGGINDGVKNGAWKYWKKDHAKAHTMTLADLSEADLKELHMEVVDMFHFFMNFALMVGMSGSDLYNYYVAKNEENFNRQKRGY